MESILRSIRKMIGPDETYTHYDTDLIIHINSVLAVLTQLGVGPSEGFFIQDESATWNDFLGNDPKLEMVKSYVYMKVKLAFDPPSSSAVIDSMNRSISEFEWRTNMAAEEKKQKIMSNAAESARFVKTDNNPPQKVKKQY